MQIVLGTLPILGSVILLLVFRQPAARAGAIGLALALAIAWLVPDYHLSGTGLASALARGGLITLIVAYVLLGGVVLYHVLRTAGAFAVIARAVAGAVPDPARQTLVLVLGLSVFFESATGFGIGIIVTAPLFLALGHPPRRAAFLALLGQCAVPWGALGIGTVLGAQLSGVAVERLGWLAGPMNLPLILLCGGLALFIVGGGVALRRHALELLLYAVTLSALLSAGSLWPGIELAGSLAGLTVTVLAILISRASPRGTVDAVHARQADGPTLAAALLPYALLLATLLATRLAPPLHDWLNTAAVIAVPRFDFSLPVLYHPGFWMIAAALASAPVLGLRRGALGTALRGAVRQWVVAALPVAAFLCLSQIMFDTGMTAALAAAISAGAGTSYVLLLPAVGGLGGFLTASNSGSNAMFAQFQSAVAGELNLPLDVVQAAQNAAGANTTLASPGRIVLAAAVTGEIGREADIMRPALAVAIAGLITLSAILWFWIGIG